MRSIDLPACITSVYACSRDLVGLLICCMTQVGIDCLRTGKDYMQMRMDVDSCTETGLRVGVLQLRHLAATIVYTQLLPLLLSLLLLSVLLSIIPINIIMSNHGGVQAAGGGSSGTCKRGGIDCAYDKRKQPRTR